MYRIDQATFAGEIKKKYGSQVDVLAFYPVGEFEAIVQFRVNHGPQEDQLSPQWVTGALVAAAIVGAGFFWWRITVNRVELARIELKQSELDLEVEKLPQNRFGGFVWPLTALLGLGITGYWLTKR